MEMDMDSVVGEGMGEDDDLAYLMRVATKVTGFDQEPVCEEPTESYMHELVNINVIAADMNADLLPACGLELNVGDLGLEMVPLPSSTSMEGDLASVWANLCTTPPTATPSLQDATEDGDYNWGENPAQITQQPNFQAELWPGKGPNLVPFGVAVAGPAAELSPAIEGEKNQYSAEEALNDFNEECSDFERASTPAAVSGQIRKKTRKSKKDTALLFSEAVNAAPENIRVVVRNKEELMRSAMECGINPAEIKVDEKLERKLPQRPRPQKKLVSPDQVTPEYLANRAKNTESARKSRDKRRAKENELILRTVYLEEKYERLQAEYARLVELKAKTLEARALAAQMDIAPN